MKRFFLILLVFIAILPLRAQNNLALNNDFGRKPDNAAQRNGKITIPVVVHIVWKEEEENISAEQVQSQIDALNRDFQQKNDQSKIPSYFSPLAANIGIEFCLARIDPKSKATKGITRTQTSYTNVWGQMGTSLSNPTPRRRIYYSILEGHDAWDTKRYLNIWVGKLGGGKAGYGSFPNATKPEDVDGIVVDPYFFGTIGTGASNVNFDKGRTAVHEVGHYLNLIHPWGSSITNFDCKDDDMVSDTPTQEEAVSGCPSGLIFHCGKKIMTMNFMNFVSDDCMSMFTEGQKKRMLDAVIAFRSELINSTACNSVGNDDKQLISNVLVYPNPVNSELTVEIPNISNAKYVIYDVAGQKIIEGFSTYDKFFINVSNFAAGFYQLGINIENQYTYRSFVKQ
jgi:hypothetical protein